MSVARYVFVLLALFLLETSPTPAAEAVRIGVSLSLTGRYAEMGNMNQRAYKMWEQDINKKGGLLGRPVRVEIVDDKSEPKSAAEIYQRLIEQDKVDLIFGPYSSPITAALLPISEKYGYPVLASGAAADKLWQQDYRYLFGVYITANKYSVGFLELLAEAGIGPIALISADDVFSVGAAEGAKIWAERFGLKIAFYEKFSKGLKNLDQIVKRARNSGAQVLMVTGHFDESVNARVALKNTGWNPRAYYATVGPVVQKYFDELQADADLTISSSQWEPSAPFPGATEFATKFKKAYGEVPSYHAASAYAAGQILEAAINRTKSLDKEKLRNILSSLDTMTIMGRYGVDQTGRQIRHFATTIQWQDGKKEIIAPKELMTAKPRWK